MARGSLLGLLLVFCVVKNKAVSKEPLEVSPGQNVTLPCTTTETIQDIRKVTVEWKINDSYVVVFRSGRLDSAEQDPQFTDRAELADPELKNGNLSLILRKTQLNDSGVYECRFGEVKSRKKRETSVPKLITNVTLEVKETSQKSPESEIGGDPTETGERTRPGLTVGLAVFAVFAVILFGGVFLKFRKRQNQKEPTETSDQSVPLSV